MKCPACSSDNRSDALFCENCGRPLESLCPRCSTRNSPDARYCRKCGAQVAPGPPDALSALVRSAPAALQDKVRAAAAQLDGERKPVTILFTDIVGSTSLAEKLDPEEWKEIVSGAHACVSQAVYRYEGTIAQLLGDGVLAFFGAPITHEDDPIRAVRAALDIQSAIRDYARSLAGYVDSFQVRIGIHTGLVVVGSIGSDMHMEYLAIGDSVNLAARLQSACTPGEVLISEATARRVRPAFELQDLGEIKVKGKTEPVHVLSVVEPKAAPGSGRGIEGLASPLVGRETELAALRSRLDALCEGHGQIVCITGEAGIGKSRLVDEGRQHFTALHWVEGRALSYGHTLSFWAVTQLIKADLGLSDADPEPRVRAALRRRLQSLDAERSSDLFPYLAHLLGIKLDGEPAERIRALDGETLKQQILLSLTSYWSRVSEACPTVLVFEDLHWADPSTLDALEHLLPLADRASVMLLLLFRLETDKGCWRVREKAAREFHHRFVEIELCPLSAAQSNELVDHLLAIAELPETTRQLILDRSEGNPFYLEEIVRSLIEQGALRREGDHWRATAQIEAVTIPDSLQALLLARIDRLEEEARRTLQLASVIGKSFLYRLLQSIAECERELESQLAHLQQVDLVREKTRRPELEYMFKHSLTQQAAYDSLLLEQRRDFHRRVGLALEQLFAERREEFYGLLAHHFDRAGDATKAAEYMLKAGDKLRHEDAQEEAIGYYRRAVELLEELGDDERAARTWLKLGLVYHTNFDFEEAHRANERAFTLQRELKRGKAPSQRRPGAPLTLLNLHTLRIHSFDPGKAYWSTDTTIIMRLFSGLAELDEEMNLIPQVARSWEILEGGTHYVFHLRDDVRWTDGTPVTAADFEWAWKRNLRLDTPSPYQLLMDDIVGAREYREGKSNDPNSVAVRALDSLTLEVRLYAPVAYFPYLMIAPITFPLPREVVERCGDEWWKPENIVTNGAFRLAALDLETRVSLRRNADYFGEFPGNLDGIEFDIAPDGPERIQAYREGRLDAYYLPRRWVRDGIPIAEQVPWPTLSVYYVAFSPDRPPLDDVRVRRALMLALDRDRVAQSRGTTAVKGARGGLVPPGMPGHTPDLGLVHDVPTAQRLLAQAGYPNGEGFPPLVGWVPQSGYELGDEMAREWDQALNIRVTFEQTSDRDDGRFRHRYHLVALAWSADCPDPANFLQQSSMYFGLREAGWHDAHYEELIEQAARATNRAQRMAMYREADRILVAGQALVLPIFYGEKTFLVLLKPYIRNLKISLFGPLIREIVKENPQANRGEE